ncbi:MAG: hypothetical protein M1836_000461 [Candelina mexicana]|nr:MAG: hypothetical protein M1836_000461 [Candelina mexicana]
MSQFRSFLPDGGNAQVSESTGAVLAPDLSLNQFDLTSTSLLPVSPINVIPKISGQPLPHLSSKRTKMSSQIPGGFGGLSMIGNTDHFSKYYAVDVDGSVQDSREVDFSLYCEDCGSKDFGCNEQIIQRAANVGLASGKIYIPLLDDTIFSLSGFWVGPLFVTCAHYYSSYYDTACQARMEELLKQGDERLVISVKCISQVGNIIFFAAVNSDEKPSHSLKADQLYALSAVDFSNNLGFLPAFTVNYSGVDSKFSVKEYQQYAAAIQGSGHGPCDGPLTKFSLLCRQLLNVIKDGVPLKEWLEYRGQDPFGIQFTDIFLSNQRAIAVGRLFHPRLDSMSGYAYQQTAKTPSAKALTYELSHTISVFYGCSGGMICWFKDNDIDQPVVVGIFRGDRGDSFNLARVFTPHAIELFEEAVAEVVSERVASQQSGTMGASISAMYSAVEERRKAGKEEND